MRVKLLVQLYRAFFIIKKFCGVDILGMKKIDIIIALIVGELIALLSFGILKGLAIKPDWIYWALPVVLPFLCLFCLWVAYLVGLKFLKSETLYDAAQFLLIGVLNTLVDLGGLNLLIWLSGISAGIWYSVFKGASFVVATLHSYLWNKFWTFEAKKTKGVEKEFAKFFIVTLIGFGINVGVASLVVNAIGPKFNLSQHIWANVGAIFASIVGIFWNFLGSKFLVFRKQNLSGGISQK